jgi:hypothetical protein
VLETLVLLSQYVGQERGGGTHHLLLLDVLHAVYEHESPASLFQPAAVCRTFCMRAASS